MSFIPPLLVFLTLTQSPIEGLLPFQPSEMLSVPGGPEAVILRNSDDNIVSLRLSIPFREEGAEAAAGQLLQVQAHQRMQRLAQRIGARAEAHRTPQALVYQVSGPAAELDFLGWILREGIAPPSDSDFPSLLRQVQLQNERRRETPRGVLATRLRSALAPDTPSVFGSAGALGRIDAARLTSVWNRTHRKEDARLVVAGRLPTQLVLLLANDLDLREGPREPPIATGEEIGSPEPDPEVIRHWIVEGYPVLAGDEAAALVVGHWLGERFESYGGDFEVGVEIWETGSRFALVVTGVAYARSRGAMEASLGTMFEDAAALMTGEEVTRVADQLRTEIIIAGRTPWGLAELVGQAWDAGNGPAGVQGLLSGLERLSAVEVRGLLGGLARTTPIREELHP